MHVRLGGAIVIVAALTWPARAEPDPAASTGDQPPPSSTSPPPASIAPAVPPPQADASTATPPKATFEPFGFLRLQYLMVQNASIDFVGRDDGFELQNARIGARGTIGTKAAYVIAIEGAVDERAQINIPQGKLKVGLKDAYADVHLPIAADIRAGYFLTLAEPNLTADTARDFVDKPIESRGMRATEGYQTPGLTPGRSLGAALRCDPKPPTSGAGFGFELAIQNGADEYASNNDN